MKKVIALLLVISMMIVPIGAVDTYVEDAVVENVSITEDDIEEFQSFIDEMKLLDDEVCNDDFVIDEIKVIYDFAGNTYYDIECLPSGYFIYCPATERYVEFSYYGVSPYKEYEGTLYYAGAMEYYTDENDVITNTITDEKLTEEDIAIYAEACSESYEARLAECELEQGEYSVDAVATSGVTEVLVAGGNFFSGLKTTDEVGYMSGGHCGYIAAGMLLLYYDCYQCDGLVSEGFLSADGRSFDGESFTRKLCSYGSNSSTAGTTVGYLQGIDEVVTKYLRANTSCSVSYLSGANADVNLPLILSNSNRPIIVFGAIYDKYARKTVNHAILVYGYTSNLAYVIAHFGYGNNNHDYSKVYLDKSNVTVGSTYRITNVYGTDESSAFDDVGFYWGRKDINRCVEKGIMVGMTDSTFEPKGYMTRGMLVTMLYRLAGKPSCSISHPFTDVSSTRYYAKPISWAYQNGIANGTSSTEFSPNEYITRTQAVRMIYRFATSYDSYSLPTTSFEAEQYPDYYTMSGETKTAWGWAIRTGTIKGDLSGGFYYLRPSDYIQRAEFASIVNRIQTNSGKWAFLT